MTMNKATNIVEYIAAFPDNIKVILEEIRTTIKQSAPEAEEFMSYGMPAYKLYSRPLVYFSAFKNHIGFYATPAGHSEFAEQLSKYKQGKGSVQFPINEPMPLQLISEIVKFRLKGNMEKKKEKKQ